MVGPPEHAASRPTVLAAGLLPITAIETIVTDPQSMIAILPCSNLDVSAHFYARLGFLQRGEEILPTPADDPYRILHDADGASLHLRAAEPGWLVPGQNPFALYYRRENVDQLAAEFVGEMVGSLWPEDRPSGMYEFAISDPDGTLIRVGWPIRLRQSVTVGR